MAVEHNTKNYSVFQVAMNLTIACLISGAIIGGTYFITEPVTLQKNIILKNQAMKALVKDAESFKTVDGKKDWFVAQKDGKVVAYVVPAESKGFDGEIKMLVAVTTDGKIIDYDILSSNETPGLGDNASKEPFKKQFKDKKIEDLIVVKDPSNINNIQAITGATISSRAVTKGIKEAAEQVVEYTGGK
ncbi:electron transport complex subunit G [Clostridium polyendosporum]|uniref:Ion-translocating oxidoreductase complex subunit G n=1 Tax=Clostridium polyendosporum TaxID=69208 RepID=A0A919S0N2_9CLOT|nr:RnfABCDGE type electron transport complex subunit G [Clostridium polyendosporum]GIM29694.1 electron transport complex subunit G [Clostridium polyendosporum]